MKMETLLLIGGAGLLAYLYFNQQQPVTSSSTGAPKGGTTTNQGTTSTAAKDAGTANNTAPHAVRPTIHAPITRGKVNNCLLLNPALNQWIDPTMPGQIYSNAACQ